MVEKQKLSLTPILRLKTIKNKIKKKVKFAPGTKEKANLIFHKKNS